MYNFVLQPIKDWVLYLIVGVFVGVDVIVLSIVTIWRIQLQSRLLQRGVCTYSEQLIIRTIQLFEHPPFPEKNLSEHPRLKLLFQYPSTYTLRSSNEGHQTSTSLRQSLWSYKGLLAYYRHFRTSTRLLQSFPNIY